MFSKSFIEEHRDINVSYDWSQDVCEFWKEKLDSLGYPGADIRFSGFWSQGDGASFTADTIDIQGWLKTRKLCNKYRSLYNYCGKRDGYFNIYRNSNHYYHHNTISVDPIVYDSYDFVVSEKVWWQLNDLVKEIEDDAISLSKEIYRDLEREYEYRVSDEAVIEALLSHGIEEFTEDRPDVFASEHVASVLRDKEEGCVIGSYGPEFIPVENPVQIANRI